jgi:hypothetical protein
MIATLGFADGIAGRARASLDVSKAVDIGDSMEGVGDVSLPSVDADVVSPFDTFNFGAGADQTFSLCATSA